MCSLVGYQYQRHYLMALNYDFYFPQGLLIVAAAGAEKKSLGQPQLRWTAIYGTVTLNQFGRELPTAGMNEAGLAGQILQQDNGPAYQTDKPSLNELQWLQHALDTCSNIDDVIAMAQRISMKWEIYPVHYGFCDAQGQLAFLSFSQYGVRVHMPDGVTQPPVLTNTEYNLACDTWREDNFVANPRRNKSDYRFERLAASAPAADVDSYEEAKQHLLQRLHKVKVEPRWWSRWLFWLMPPRSFTVWTTLFEPQARRLEFFTLISPGKKNILLDASLFKRARQANGLVFDLNNPAQGDIGAYLKPYQRQHNARLIEIAYPKNLLNAQERNALIEYPETFEPII